MYIGKKQAFYIMSPGGTRAQEILHLNMQHVKYKVGFQRAQKEFTANKTTLNVNFEFCSKIIFY